MTNNGKYQKWDLSWFLYALYMLLHNHIGSSFFFYTGACLSFNVSDVTILYRVLREVMQSQSTCLPTGSIKALMLYGTQQTASA